MSLDAELARLERQVLGVARVRSYLVAVAEIQRMLAAETPGVRERVLKLAAPQIGRDLAAAVSTAFDRGFVGTVRDVGRKPDRQPRPSVVLPFVTAARETQAAIVDDMKKARKLARSGADDATVFAPIAASAHRIQRDVVTLVNHAGNAGVTAAADALNMATVWVAEFNACVTCLRYSGEVARVGKDFPAGLTYGKRSTMINAVPYPPAHPSCRCTVEALNDPSYAAALRREADRSVLRGFSLESESMATRIDAADRLLRTADLDAIAPKSVVAYARRAVKRGEFSTRGRP